MLVINVRPGRTKIHRAMINYPHHGVEVVGPVELVRPITVAELTVIHSETPVVTLICAADLDDAVVATHRSCPAGVNEFDASDPGYF